VARFEDALPVIMAHEGGWSNHKDDPGGATNHGITFDTFRAVRGPAATLGELRSLSEDEAAAIYRARYWLPVYDLIDDQNVGTKVFDMAVNMGHRQAHRLTQRACGECGYRVADDGLIGPSTLAAINSCSPPTLLLAMCHEQVEFYRDLAVTRPTMQAFLDGWLKRAAWVGEKSNEAQEVIT
jgi:lysozyme family protein